jgi:hypothetical protein
MANRLTRGSAIGRSQHESQRPGSFKKGHKKLGGRKRGTPNVMTKEYKNSFIRLFASDQKGDDDLLNLLKLVAIYNPRAFCKLLCALV